MRRYVDQHLTEIVLKSDDGFPEDHGAIAALWRGAFALASLHAQIIHLVIDDLVVDACNFVVPRRYKNITCHGLISSLDFSRLYALYGTEDGILFIVWFHVSEDRIEYAGDYPLSVPQGYRPQLMPETYHKWNASTSIDEVLPTPIGPDMSFFDLQLEFPIGPALNAYKPWMGSDGSKVFIAVNHLQQVIFPQQHEIWFVTPEIMEEWRAEIQNIDYTKEDWWSHTVEQHPVQRFHVCDGVMICTQCGREWPCNDHTPISWAPQWDETGEPIVELQNVDIVRARTTFQVPVLVASIVVFDVLTGKLIGTTHFGATQFGFHYENDSTARIITGMDVHDGVVDIMFGLQKKSIPTEFFLWGSSPMQELVVYPTNPYGSLAFHDFLLWWDRNHIGWGAVSNPQAYYAGIEIGRHRYGAQFSVSDFEVSDDIRRSQTIMDFARTNPVMPFTSIAELRDLSLSPMDNVGYAVYNKQVMQYTQIAYSISSYFAGKLLDTRPDIMVGRVLRGEEKIVDCVFTNEDPYLDMINITLEIVADVEYPYYMFCKLSSGGPFGYTITLPDIPAGGTANFQTSVYCTTTSRDPKPVQVRVRYLRRAPDAP